jgi:hypothetical protein
MSAVIKPTVLNMILCDEVLHDSERPGKLTIVGLISLLRWPAGSTTPLRLEKLVVLLILTDGRGTGRGRIVCSNEETGQPIFGSGELPISFVGKNPSLPFGVQFALRDCRFPAPGAYLVRFLFEDEVISQQSLIVR